ncbi:hypothetical protein [Roseibium sp.]|uniref:hypothetical protein n=1 Tax=Roseibium sp. TaxID=1936156 RepID=UPI003B525C6B
MVWTLGDFISKGFVLAAVTALAACQAADGTTVAPDTALVNNIMAGLGAVDPNKKEIDYKPRAPLAMPAEGSNLPEPETQVAGTNAANWPQERNNEELNALRDRYKESYDYNGDLKRLTPEQMAGFEIVGSEKKEFKPGKLDVQRPDGSTNRISVEEMKTGSKRFDELKQQKDGSKSAEFALKRNYLIEPPAAYSTPSADAPMPSANIEVKKTYAPLQRDHESNRLDPRCLEGNAKYC